jgi:hypothetical protein
VGAGKSRLPELCRMTAPEHHFAKKIGIVFNSTQANCGMWALSAVGSYDTV